MSDHEFTFSVQDLDAGGRELRYAVRPAWVRGALEGHEASAGESDGNLVIRASRSGRDVVVRGAVDVALELPCARCLERFRFPVHSDLSVLFVPRADLRAAAGDDDEAELTEEEANTLPFEGDTVVLDELVRDELLLEIPMIPLCSETCPGMSPAPDAAPAPEPQPLDPRLAPLLKFRGTNKA